MSATQAGTVMIGETEVARLGFGSLRLTGPGGLGEPPNRAAAMAVLRRALDLGVTLIDTADSYGPEVSERLIRDALHPYPDGVVIATKGGLVHGVDRPWGRDARPEQLRAACEGSLRRLGVDSFELYQLHAPDPNVPIEESLGAIVDMVTEGKIRHVGVCNVDLDELRRARSVTPIVSVQNRYNLLDRSADPVIETCERDEIPFMPWYPLGRGSLTAGRDEALASVAARHGVTPAQAALAWLLARSPMMLPIPGTSRVDHLELNVAAAGIRLERHDLDALDAGSARVRG